MPLRQQHVDSFNDRLKAIEGLPNSDRETIEREVTKQLRPLVGNPRSTGLSLSFLHGLSNTIRHRTDLRDLHAAARQQLLDLLRETAEVVAESANEGSLDAETWLASQDR